jgi:hypothetical protein
MPSAGLPGRSGVGAPSRDGNGLGPHFPTSLATPNPTGQSRRGRPHEQCPRRGQPAQRGQIGWPTDPRRQARSAQNALKHGFGAEKHVVLPLEDGTEFAALEAAMLEELAPIDALQTVLARRVAVAA